VSGPETAAATGDVGRAVSDPVRRRALERNVRKLYGFAFLVQFQLWFPIWVTYLMVERGLSLAQVAALEAPFWLIAVLAEVPTGALADRWGRSTSLVVGAALYSAAIACFGLASTLALLMVSYLGWAVSLTFISGADSALLFDTLKALGRESEYERCAGRSMVASSAGVLAATFAGAPLAAATTLNTPILISAGILALAALVASSIEEPPRLEEGSAQLSYLAGVRAAGRVVWSTPTVRTVIPFAAVTGAAMMASEYLTQPFLLSHGVEVGLMFSAIQVPIRVAGMIGAIAAFALVVRAGEVRAIVAVPLVGLVAYAGLALWNSLWAVSLLAVVGLVRSASRPIVSGYLNRRIPSAQRATVLSLHHLAFGLFLVPIVPILGVSADRIDLPAGFAAAALVLAGLGTATGVLWVRAHRRAAARTRAESAPPRLQA
jgi:MFS family permease